MSADQTGDESIDQLANYLNPCDLYLHTVQSV